MWWLLAALACTPDPAPAERVESPDVAARKVIATLEEADALAREGQAEEAHRAWLRAYATFESSVEKPLGLVYGPQEAVLLEYRFAIIRDHMERRERCADDISVLKQAFASLGTD